MESNALTIYRPLTPTTWTMIQSVAPAMHEARLFGISSPQQAMVIMLKGYELGLGLAASFEFIQVVEGKPALSPRGALAMIMQSPLCAGVKIEDIADDQGNPVACRVWMKRTNGMEYSVTWTMEDARRAGLVKSRGAWETYPGNLLRWRAVGYCADVVFPDVIGGLKRADELGADITSDGDVIEGSWRTAPEPAPGPAMTGTISVTLTDLVAQYGAERILEANEGVIPGTDAEIARVAEILMEAA
jgi:hypothetical protein